MISYIIPNWNQRELLSECITSIHGEGHSLPHEIIIVDNGSTDGSVEHIKRAFPHIILLENSVNLGFAKALNQGIVHSQGEYIFILNNDVRLPGDTSERLLSFLAGVHEPTLIQQRCSTAGDLTARVVCGGSAFFLALYCPQLKKAARAIGLRTAFMKPAPPQGAPCLPTTLI